MNVSRIALTLALLGGLGTSLADVAEAGNGRCYGRQCGPGFQQPGGYPGLYPGFGQDLYSPFGQGGYSPYGQGGYGQGGYGQPPLNPYGGGSPWGGFGGVPGYGGGFGGGFGGGYCCQRGYGW